MRSDDGLLPPQRQRLEQAMAEFLSAEESGAPLDRAAFLSEYADLEDHLRTFLAAHDEHRGATAGLPSPTVATGGGTAGPNADVTIDLGSVISQSGAATIEQPTGRRFGNYALLEEIARGGMGVVWKARHVKLNRVVALKMILSGQL